MVAAFAATALTACGDDGGVLAQTDESFDVATCEALRGELEESLRVFLNDGLDPVPGESPTPEALRASLDGLAADAHALVALDAGVVSRGAQTAADAAVEFASFLDRVGDIRRYTDSSGDQPIDDELNAIIDTIEFEAIANGSCGGATVGEAAPTAGGADDAAIAGAIAARVAAGPESVDECPLFTGIALAEAAGFSSTFDSSESTLRRREVLGDSVFCFFSGDPSSANVLVFTDTTGGAEAIAAALEFQDLGSASASDFANGASMAGGTGSVSHVDGSAYGLWIADDGSWGLSQYAPSLDAAGLEATVELVRAALA